MIDKEDNCFISVYDRNLFHQVTPDNIIFTNGEAMSENDIVGSHKMK